MEKSRLHALDLFRGLAISLMVIHHGAYSYRYIFNGGIDLYRPFLGIAVIFVCLFFSISGISSHLSRSNLKRAIKTLAVAALISIVSYMFGKDTFIVFGVIHCLGFCMLIYSFIGKYTDKLFGKQTPAIWALLFIVTFFITNKKVDIPNLFIFGFYDSNFYSADYYPIFPWIFMFFFGGSIADFVIGGGMPKWFYNIKNAPIEWVGRNTLMVYLLHQPVIIAVLYIVTKLFNH